MTIDLDALEKNLRGHQPNDCIVEKKGLLELIQRLREAEKDALIGRAVRKRMEMADWFIDMNAGSDWREFLEEIEQQRKIATGEDLGL